MEDRQTDIDAGQERQTRQIDLQERVRERAMKSIMTPAKMHGGQTDKGAGQERQTRQIDLQERVREP